MKMTESICSATVNSGRLRSNPEQAAKSFILSDIEDSPILLKEGFLFCLRQL
jgi:hypothetical protein